MSEELPKVSEQSIKSLEVSSDKNNRLLTIFALTMLYIFVSVLNTTDLMLLLPVDTFKIPLIGFELNLIYFYILAPIILLWFHTIILWNYHKHLEKLDVYKADSTIESIYPSIYNNVYFLSKNDFMAGIHAKVWLWILIYLIPLLVFVAIFQRFADYHHESITPFHIMIIVFDIIFICNSLYETVRYFKHILASYLFGVFILLIGVLEVSYYFIFFNPLINEYNSDLMSKEEEGIYQRAVCDIHHLSIFESVRTEECFPRIVITDKNIVNITSSSLYVPRQFIEKSNYTEKELILKHGARINLSNRNLRYANFSSSILTRANMKNTQLQGTGLKGTHLQAVEFEGAKLQDSNLMEAQLQNAKIYDVQLQGAILFQSNLTYAIFINSNLSGARLNFANMTNTSFYDSNLSGATLLNANITNINFGYSDPSGNSIDRKDCIYEGYMYPEGSSIVEYTCIGGIWILL